MVRQLALQYADKGININAIVPGPIEGSDSSMYNSKSIELMIANGLLTERNTREARSNV